MRARLRREEDMRRTLAVNFIFILWTIAAIAQSSSHQKTLPSASVEDEKIQKLEAMVGTQQQEIESQRQRIEQLSGQVEQLLEATRRATAQSGATQNELQQAQQAAETAQRTADLASGNAVQAKTALALVTQKTDAEEKRIGALEGPIGRFRFSGDVRLRGESFFQDCSACFNRNRARMRARFGVEGRLNDDFLGGIYFATGSLGDSNSTNETMSNFFNRKSIGLDRAYVVYQPVAWRWLQLTGGKFAFTWQRTSVTFDSDLNPEGFAEKLSFDLKKAGRLKNVSLQAHELLFSENNDAKLLTGHDSFAVGAQISGRLQLGPLTSTPSLGVLKWRNVDAILNANAFAVQATTTGSTSAEVGPLPAPGEGSGCAKGQGLPAYAPCAYGPQGFTNATFLDANGKPHFLSQFLYLDLILNNQVQTGLKRFPLNMLLEYENNLNAADHPLDVNGNPTTLGKQSHAYLIDVSLGQTKNKNDFQFGYAWLRQEQDSSIASFVESENRAPTNILQHRIYVLWKLRQNTVASYTLWVGRTLNSGLQHSIVAAGTTPGEAEAWLQRHQFDLIYTF
jgi:hypothetical protein